jgi:hypothetical protein
MVRNQSNFGVSSISISYDHSIHTAQIEEVAGSRLSEESYISLGLAKRIHDTGSIKN